MHQQLASDVYCSRAAVFHQTYLSDLVDCQRH
ncbi:hypothetical protein CH47_4253 (plasmid) [Yersinia enterocolitica]|nr:hypothetical protein CH47_4253 [Yersinia enterocolitica]